MTLLRPIKSRIKSLLGIQPPPKQNKTEKDYWQTRKNFRYYVDVIRLAKQHAGEARSVIDVGPRDTPFVLELDWITSRTALDLEFAPTIPNTTNIQGDFLQYQPTQKFDLVLCLQVLEHLDDPRTFAQKLLATGKTVILSVPYMWPLGFCKYHLQDPIDEEKILGWTGKPFVDKAIVTDDGLKRIIGVFEGNAA
jgi:hypothetical protein